MTLCRVVAKDCRCTEHCNSFRCGTSSRNHCLVTASIIGAFPSTFVIDSSCPWPFSFDSFAMPRAVICWWPSPTQSTLVSDPVRTHDHIFLLFKTTYIFWNFCEHCDLLLKFSGGLRQHIHSWIRVLRNKSLWYHVGGKKFFSLVLVGRSGKSMSTVASTVIFFSLFLFTSWSLSRQTAQHSFPNKHSLAALSSINLQFLGLPRNLVLEYPLPPLHLSVAPPRLFPTDSLPPRCFTSYRWINGVAPREATTALHRSDGAHGASNTRRNRRHPTPSTPRRTRRWSGNEHPRLRCAPLQ